MKDRQYQVERLKKCLIICSISYDADKLFDALSDTASQLPFSIDDVVGAYIRLAMFDLRPSIDTINAYANVASVLGTRGEQSLRQVIDVVVDSIRMESVRLKDFGIVARKKEEKVDITFRGNTKSVDAAANAIPSFIEQLGKTEFAGAQPGLAIAVSNVSEAAKNLTIAFKGLFNERESSKTD